jgi:hypothetical protein
MKHTSQTPIASERWRALGNMLLISARVDGASVAPAIPRAARAAISMAALTE